MFNKNCRWLDSNSGPLVSEAPTLPTAAQPLPNCRHTYSAFVAVTAIDSRLNIVSATPALDLNLYRRHDPDAKPDAIGWAETRGFDPAPEFSELRTLNNFFV